MLEILWLGVFCSVFGFQTRLCDILVHQVVCAPQELFHGIQEAQLKSEELKERILEAAREKDTLPIKEFP